MTTSTTRHQYNKFRCKLLLVSSDIIALLDGSLVLTEVTSVVVILTAEDSGGVDTTVK